MPWSGKAAVSFVMSVLLAIAIDISESFANPLCGEKSEASLSVLIGPFLELGKGGTKSEDDVTKQLVAEVLESKSDITQPGHGRSFVVFRTEDEKFRLARSFIDTVFLNGLDKDDQRFQNVTKALSEQLKTNNCDYVVGGLIRPAIDEKLRLITPLLFDADTASLQVPFEELLETDRLVGQQIGRGFADYLSKPVARVAPLLQFGCFLPADPRLTTLDLQRQENLHQIMDRLKFNTIRALSGNSRLTRYGLRLQSLDCPSANGPVSDPTIVFTAKVEAYPEVFHFRPQVVSANWKGGFNWTLEPISLSPGNYEGSKLEQKLQRQYSGMLRLFILTFVREGIEPSGQFFKAQNAVSEDIGTNARKLDDLLLAGRVPEAYALAYSLISAAAEGGDNSDFQALGYYALGRGLEMLSRDASETLLAKDTLMRAQLEETNFPDIVRARLNEALGLALFKLGGFSEATAYSERAAKLYDSLNMIGDSKNVWVRVAQARIDRKDWSGARRQLEKIKDPDPNTLLQLAQLKIRTRDLEGAESTLRQASSRLGHFDGLYSVYVELGDSLLAEAQELSDLGDCRSAIEQFRRAGDQFRFALDIREDERIRYVLGFLKYKQENYSSALDDFAKVMKSNNQTPTFRWIEAASLNSIESWILQGGFEQAKRGATDAINGSFEKVQDSRLLAQYLQLVALALEQPMEDASLLRSSPVYVALKSAGEAQSPPVRLSWQNERISRKLERGLAQNPDRLMAVREIEKELFADVGEQQTCW